VAAVGGSPMGHEITTCQWHIFARRHQPCNFARPNRVAGIRGSGQPSRCPIYGQSSLLQDKHPARPWSPSSPPTTLQAPRLYVAGTPEISLTNLASIDRPVSSRTTKTRDQPQSTDTRASAPLSECATHAVHQLPPASFARRADTQPASSVQAKWLVIMSSRSPMLRPPFKILRAWPTGRQSQET
jgi:hypothetical protein